MVINPNAEIELKSPKANLYLEVQNVAIEITKPQYLTMVDLLESIDCMVKNGPYRKFRPDVPVHTNAKHWWKYGVNSVLDVHIRRFNQMWSWSNIRKHRHTLKAYRAAYKSKLLATQGKLKEDQEKQIQDLEKSLDVFNITLARQQAQIEVGLCVSVSIGYSGSSHNLALPKQVGLCVSVSIGYSGSSHNLALPKQYVAVMVTFKLFRTSITVREEPNVPEILKLTVNSMAEFFQTGKGVDLEVLTSATLSKLEEIKEKTATGLSHIIETRKILDLKIDLKPSYLLVPKSGFYHAKSDLMIIDFGSLQLMSVDQGNHQPLSPSFSSLEEIMDRAYERFKVSGELPLLHVKISDQKIQGVLDLVYSIPLPQSGSTPSTPTQKADQENTLLVLSVSQLGAEGKMRTYDLTITSYLRRVGLDYCEIRDSNNQPLHLVSSSDEHGSDLLKVEYTKADINGPNFKTMFDNTEQNLKLFQNQHFLLHTKALLSTINYLNTAVPQGLTASKDREAKRQVEKAGQGKTVSKGAKHVNVFNFKLFAMLGSFHVEVCDDRQNIADIRIQGIDASVLVQAKETAVFARLRDIVVMDVDPKTIHKKAVSIVGEEVFSFKMSLYPSATEGEGYSDTSKVDGKVTMRLGCIQITFLDNFQTAKEALSAATAQAAEKAASSIRDFAQKSFRLSMDIKLKAPLIIIPQSSTSHNALEVDLGLITVGNSFSLMSAEGFPLPVVLDTMDVKLTRLKLSRTTLKQGSPQPDIEILQPINLELLVKRNLASSWYNKIPGVEVQGMLKSMNMVLGQEDFGVLMKILAELAEKHQLEVMSLPVEAGGGGQPAATTNGGGLGENIVNMLLNLEIKELGIHTNVRKYDMVATTYIKKISMKCLEFPDSSGEPLCLVTFTSLDLLLHTEALLSTIDFLSSALSSGSLPPSPEEPKQKSEESSRPVSTKSTALGSPSDSDVIDLKVMMQLGAFNVLVCDRSCNMADIKIQGFNGCLLMQGPQTHISTRLRDFIVINVDPKSIHKKAISIVGDEVFSFTMSLTPKATEGDGYTDTSKTDGKVKLNVGCIQVIYLHKFVMSLLHFSNNFQTAKEALSAATAQAAEKAASSIRDFAQKSFRLSMDIKLKAPLIIIPQSSTSHNALEVDLGLITVGNSFSLLAVEGCPLPAVIDHMDVQLTQLKLTELLEPVNLVLKVKRNLAAAWYHKMAAVEVDGDLKPMKVALSQDDLTVLLRILMENFGEASSLQPDQHTSPDTAALKHRTALMLKTDYPKDANMVELPEQEVEEEPLETMKFVFNIESLGLVLYSNDPKQASAVSQHQEGLCLGEFTLHLIKASGKMFNNGAMEASSILTACTLDDMRTGIQRVTSRMLGKRGEESEEAMIDVTYAQSASERQVVAVFQKLYLCASVEFLMAVADFFIQALPQSSAQAVPTNTMPDLAKTSQLPLKQLAELRDRTNTDPRTGSSPRTKLRVVIVDPEVVFVANLMRADAPALVASFQCDFSLMLEPGGGPGAPGGQSMTANLRELKVLACPFIRTEENQAVTTISPVILNTVKTITAAMTAKPIDEAGEEEKIEVTESFSDQDGRNVGESFKVDVKVIQVTMESGLGHRTVPLLLAESSLSGTANNWSSLLYLCADMTLEVNYFNETHAVWEPLIERVEDGKRRWNLKLEAFSEGTASTFDHSLKEKAPFTIRNALGVPLTVQHSANLRVVASPGQGKLHEVGVGQSVDLEHSVFGTSTRGKLSALQRQESCLFNLSIVPTGYSGISNMAVDKPGRRLYNVRDPMLQEDVSVLLQVDASEGNKVITVRSPLQIQNHFSVPFAILKYCPTSRGLVNIGLAEPEKESHVALDSYRCQLFLQPAGRLEGQYGPSSTCIAWKEQVHLSSEVRSLLQCPSADSSFLPLQVTTLATPDRLAFISSQREDDWDPAYVIHLHPAVTLRNLLPYSFRYLLEGSAEFHELREGSTADILNARIGGEIMEVVLVKYQGRNWSSRIRIAQDMQEFFPVCFTCDSDEKLTVDLSVHVTRPHGRLTLAVFSPYWIINKTSRVLQYRAEDVSVKHASDFRDVILFSFKKKNIFSKNKLQLCVSTSSWSDGFSLDTMSSFNVTKIVTMSPFFTLVNKSSYELECIPLWPELVTGKLCVRVVGSDSNSKSFFFNKQDNGTLLGMGQYGGVVVDVNISDNSTVISFTDYYDGAAPALVVNHTPWVTITYRQSQDKPRGLPGTTLQASANSAGTAWSTARVLLFTEDVAVVTKARQAEELEQFQQEVNVSLQNLGLSLINNDNRQEIAYVGITSSGVVWEMRPKNRWKSFNQRNIRLLEKAYQKHMSGGTPEPGWVKLETNLEVEFKQSPHQRSLRAQLHWLQ
ncbi:unnamed protein product, partial [Coregonus sp. 'balchen']